ncbi:eCIS core domain-containing protein [Methanosarcina sp.]|uniref:eCIS core domain-containing protein n=1 Tax=Methanosarcina sp. TaxID=2213 RepID=UPI003C785F1D
MAEKSGISVRTQEPKQKSSNFFKQKPSYNSSGSPAESVLEFQRTAGNQAVQRLIKSGALQAKLKIGKPNDIYEQEADRVAEQVMRKSDPVIQRKCANCAEDKKKILQSRESSGQLLGTQSQDIPSIVHEVLHSPGQPLNAATRTYMEPRFGHDFSRVRVHTDTHAAESAHKINALAYTVGQNIVFAAEQYSPGTERGDKLLAHELTHTVQQMPNPSVWRRRLSACDDEKEDEFLEKEGASSTQMLRRTPAIGGTPVTTVMESYLGLALQRAPDDEILEETAGKITERSAEKAWSETSPGITKQEQPRESFLLMNFAISKDELKKEHQEFLRDTIYFRTLTSDPMAKIVIIGHADSTGSKSFNNRLARSRAQETEKAFRQMGRHNLRIETVTGKGANEPIAQNDSVFGRAENRRVEILVKPWKPEKPVPELLTELQKGMKPFVVKVDNFTACPFQDTVKSIAEEAFKSIPTVRFDWEGKSTTPEAFISFDDTTTFSKALGLTGDIFLNSFRKNKICKIPGDDKTCEKVFPETANFMGHAIANTVVHETGHALALDHVPATDNFMWTPELHPLHAKANKTFDEKVLLQRTLQLVSGTFNASQFVHMVNRIKEKRKTKPGVVEFE